MEEFEATQKLIKQMQEQDKLEESKMTSQKPPQPQPQPQP